MRRSDVQVALVASAALLAGACSTPTEVRNLSLETSRAATDLSIALQQNAATTVELNAARVRALGWINDDNATARAGLEQRVAAAEKVRDPVATQYKAIIDFVVTQQTNLEKAEAASRKTETDLKNALLAPNLGLEDLRTVGATLTDLGDEETFKTRLIVAGEFAGDVAKRVVAEKKKAEEKAKATANANPKTLPLAGAPAPIVP